MRSRHARPIAAIATLGVAITLTATCGHAGGQPGLADNRVASSDPTASDAAAPFDRAPDRAPARSADRTGQADRAGADPVDQAPRPTRVRIPAIDVDASMIPLGLRVDGTIEVPTEADQAGWWVDGHEPGEVGPAVILGHVDSRTGPAVFFRLTDLQPGDRIHVDREDHTIVTYEVQSLEQYAKDEFPTEAVYGSTDQPVLRLVTCGGPFDRGDRSYEDNVIVFATEVHLATPRVTSTTRPQS